MGQILYYIALPFGYLMKFCIFISPGHSFIVALIFFTFIIQALLCLIFGIKQQKNMIKQASMAPRAAAIRKKYAGRDDAATKNKMQEETMALYQENGYSPLSGCLPMVIQFPVIMALYYVIISPLQYICMLSADVVNKIISAFYDAGNLLSDATMKALEPLASDNYASNRSAQVEIINKINEWTANGSTDNLQEYVYQYAGKLEGSVLPTYKLFGMDFSVAPPYPNADNFGKFWPLLLIPVLIVAVMIASQLITRHFMYQDPTMKQQQNSCSMKAMTYSMPLVSAWISFSLPAAVGVYWIYRSVAATLQQMLLSKLMPVPTFTEEDYKAAEKEILGTSNKKKKKLAAEKKANSGSVTASGKRSLHHIDDDDASDTESTDALPEGKNKKGEKASGKEDDTDNKNGEVVNGGEVKNVRTPDSSDAPVLKDDKGKTRYEKK